MANRIVTLIDMDCFYCQVETRLNPSLKGKPMAVVQYNMWMGGGIIAVNYEARDRGVTRHMRGEEAKKHCPEIVLVSVPSVRGKADLTKYRDAGREVAAVLCEFSKCVERASVDEAYIDITDIVNQRMADDVRVTPEQLMNTFVVGYSSQNNNDEDERLSGVSSWLNDTYSNDLIDLMLKRLAIAAHIVEEMRAAIYSKTSFRCSAGIAHNKILAKLVCGLHKPNRQTVLPLSGVTDLYQTLPIKKVRSLGGKLGDDVKERLQVSVMADLLRFSENELQFHYGTKTGSWLYNIARGIDLEPVTPRLVSNSIGCCKKFPGRNALATKQSVEHWLSELVTEVAERLEEDLTMNKRRAQLLTVTVHQDQSGNNVSMSRSAPLLGNEPEKITACAMSILSRMNSAPESSSQWIPALKYLGLSASKFIDHRGNTNSSINQYFKNSESVSTSKTCAETSKDNTLASQDKYSVNTREEKNKDRYDFIGNYFRITNCGKAVREHKEVEVANNEQHTNNEEKHNSFFERQSVSACRTGEEVSNQFGKEKVDNKNSVEDKENQRKEEKWKSSFFERYLKNKFMKLNDETNKRNGIYIPDEVADCLFPKSDVLEPGSSSVQKPSSIDRKIEESIEKSSSSKRPLVIPSNVDIMGNEDNYCEEEEETVSKYFKNSNNTTATSTTSKTNSIDNNSSTSCNMIRSEEVGQNVEEQNDENIEVWISPSEIFPDLDNIDEDTLSLLPSQFQREIVSKRNKKRTNELTKEIQRSHDDCDDTTPRINPVILRTGVYNRVSDFSNASSSDAEPSTEIQVVASVHVPEDEYVHSLDNCTENKVEKQHHNGRTETVDLNATCLDIFAAIEDNDSIHSYRSIIMETESHSKQVTEICVHCGKQIPLIDMPEHLDHHIAVDLDKELNRGTVPVRTVTPADSISSKKKRGRQNKKDLVSAIPNKKLKTITSFFTHR